MPYARKLIEVALPLDAINVASAREKSIRHGHPSTLHLWWARRPLAAARAVLFAQLVDDPSAHPEDFPTEELVLAERKRLHEIIEQLVLWENTTNETVLDAARAEIRASWRKTCAANKDHPRAAELFNPAKLPAFHDPFAGGGAIPLEAQRLGLEAYASDLNPVAVLINKAMIEIPPKFAGRPPVNPEARGDKQLFAREWKGARGLAEDVRYYGQWMRTEAEKRIGHLYPRVEITAAMAQARPDLKPLVGRKLTVIAWLWARTVRSPNPAFAHVQVPLASTFMLSTKEGKEAYVQPVIEGDSYRFSVKVGTPPNEAKFGTKAPGRGANFACLMSGTPLVGDYIKAEGRAGLMDARLMAVVAEGDKGRVYLSPTDAMERVARSAIPDWKPEVEISGSTQYLGAKPYGMVQFSQLFTNRQLVALTTFSDLVEEARSRAEADAVYAGLSSRLRVADADVNVAKEYANAISVYLAFAVDKGANYWSSICAWHTGAEKLISTFGRQAIPMVWDYTETNPFSGASGNWSLGIEQAAKMLVNLGFGQPGLAFQAEAQSQTSSLMKVVSTDPPYYDNVPYADISDFFYVWLRRSLKLIKPELFATVAVPKDTELVAFAYRHANKLEADAFFLSGMTQAMHRLTELAHSSFPVTIYYAFRQSDSDSEGGTVSTGWDTFLESVIRAGFGVSGTWPVRTEYTSNLKTQRNALASSIVLVCRPRDPAASTATRREFGAALKATLPKALRDLQRGGIAPVDLAQAAIGPGMAVYTSYAKVVDASGRALSVREALALINQTLDEVLAEQEGDFDADTRWAVAWFEQFGFDAGEFGVADVLARAKNTSVGGMVESGIVWSRAGKVSLIHTDKLSDEWDPATDPRVNVWEVTHRLIRALNGGEVKAAALLAQLGARADAARELAYRLYVLCERKKRPADALAYNALVQSWPAMERLAREQGERHARVAQERLL